MYTALLIVLISAIANFALIALIAAHGKARQTNYYFILMTLGIIGWIVSNYFSNFVKDYQYALIWNKLIFVMSAIAGWSFLVFSDVFPNEQRPPEKKFFWISLFLLTFVIFISLSPYLVEKIIIKENISEITFGAGVYFYIVFLLGCLLLAFIKIIIKYSKSKDIVIRKTISLVGIGMAIFLILSIGTNLLLPVLFEKFELTNWAPFYTVIFLLVISISILRYGFMEVRVILTELLVGVFSVLLLTQIFLSNSIWQYIWNITIFIIFLLFGHLFIKSIFREIRIKQKIGEASWKVLEQGEVVSENFKKVMSDREKLLKEWFLSDVNKELEINALKNKIKELEGKSEKK